MIMKTKVYILYTGGTIGMAPKDPSDPNSSLEPKPLSRLLKFLPGSEATSDKKGDKGKRKSISAKLMSNQTGASREVFTQEIVISYNRDGEEEFALPRGHNIVEMAIEKPLVLDNGNEIYLGSGSFEHPVDSSDITPEAWKMMAQMIASVYDDYDAFIILHGTDTMAYTASGLSFIFENLGKPVIITGSQLPISGIRTDAILNLVNAIYIAGYKATDLPKIPEVAIVFADKIIRGCRATKVSTADWAGFDSPNFPLLGAIGEHININTNYVLPSPPDTRKFFIKTDLISDVFNINIFPGFTNQQMAKILLDAEVKGIVMRTYGTGNVPNNPEFLDTISDAIKEKNKLVVSVTQCVEGMVEMGLYEASSGLLERGVISGLDMTPEAALAKMMWTLGTQFGQGRTTQMQISQRGEQTENLFDLRFGALSKEAALSKAESIYTQAVSPDGRLDRKRIAKSMLRISDLGIEGVAQDAPVRLKVFMNMPSANYATPETEERCVCIFEFKWDGKPETKMKNITYKTQNVIGDGDVILTLVPEAADVKIYFSGLYIAIYATA